MSCIIGLLRAPGLSWPCARYAGVSWWHLRGARRACPAAGGRGVSCCARAIPARVRRGGSGHKDLTDLPIRGARADRTDFVAALDQGAIERRPRLLVAQRQIGAGERAPLPPPL